jgi:hypothetical protein
LQKPQPELTLQESFWGSNRTIFDSTEIGQIQHQREGVLHPPHYQPTPSKSGLPQAGGQWNQRQCLCRSTRRGWEKSLSTQVSENTHPHQHPHHTLLYHRALCLHM